MIPLESITDVAGIRAVCQLLDVSFSSTHAVFWVGSTLIWKRVHGDGRTDVGVMNELRRAVMREHRSARELSALDLL